jgi:hypothetical protein
VTAIGTRSQREMLKRFIMIAEVGDMPRALCVTGNYRLVDREIIIMPSCKFWQELICIQCLD